MNLSGDVQGSLKEALYETLNGILSSHQETRQAAEQRIQALEVTEEFGVHLTEFVVDQNGLLPIRQLASVLLKQYVENHWTTVAEKFRSPEIKPEMKERIKELLPLGLRESISKVNIFKKMETYNKYLFIVSFYRYELQWLMQYRQ